MHVAEAAAAAATSTAVVTSQVPTNLNTRLAIKISRQGIFYNNRTLVNSVKKKERRKKKMWKFMTRWRNMMNSIEWNNKIVTVAMVKTMITTTTTTVGTLPMPYIQSVKWRRRNHFEIHFNFPIFFSFLSVFIRFVLNGAVQCVVTWP